MNHVHNDIPGWFDWEETYEHWVHDTPDHGRIVEVGCFQGRSLAYLLVELANHGRRDVEVHAVDNWVGIDDVTGIRLSALFDRHIRPLSYPVHVHSMDSVGAAAGMSALSADRIWLDGSHTHEDVYKDLEAWWPVLKVGGEMGGHDFSSEPGVSSALHRWSEARHVPFEVLPSCHAEGPRTSSWLVRKAQA